MLKYDQSDVFSRKMITKRVQYTTADSESSSLDGSQNSGGSDEPVSNGQSGFEGGSDDGRKPSIGAPKAEVGGNFDFESTGSGDH